ncbi:riboflavin synthase [Ectobacillus ponti]|uniref:Riboflavin synthase n=1 Tax=Ectobacillus ponti TaxID=2961894 RepID=A0AA41X5F1_9BACI|nr:riboflavin synthase [Ectobacillus ponti]MCP8966979.1 riboflavin synthase [Ectobacillus ponti]
MFTGIIEETGTIMSMQQAGQAIAMMIKAERILSDVQLGDSIAVNGVCLTVTSFTKSSFTVDVMPETVKATSLQSLQRGSSVNLERAMGAGGRFGGHFVTGHVDGIGRIAEKRKQDNAMYYRIELPENLLRYCIYKGSVAIDGTSLTIFGLDDTSITISLIPHTVGYSIVGHKGTGDIVNIECDMIGKYIERFTRREEPPKRPLTESFLRDHGYL